MFLGNREKKKLPSKHAETVWVSFIKNYEDEETTFFSMAEPKSL